MVVDKYGTMLDKDKKVERIDLIIIIFDQKDNFIKYLSPIRDVQNCHDIQRSVNLLYQNYLSMEAPQTLTKCEIFFAYHSLLDKEYTIWAGGTYQLKSYKQAIPLFYSTNGIDVKEFKYNQDEMV